MSTSPDPAEAQRTRADAGMGDIHVPPQLGAVQLLAEIGRGAMGVVWRGHDRILARPVAVKFLLSTAANQDDPGFLRFLEGARAAAAVRHPGLTGIHQADLHEGLPYLVMELVDGPTCDELIRRLGPLSPAAAVHTGLRIAEAVAALHERGIVHRDIKSSNILVDGAGALFVTDFGLACRRPAGGVARVAGTPAYMAPEMFAGAVSTRTDVYALGVLLFELLTGDVSFSGDFESLRRQHEESPLPLERLRAPDIPAPLIELIERATHKNPLFRFKSAEAVLRALRELPPAPAESAAGPRTLALLVERWRAAPVTRPARTQEEPTEYYARIEQRASERRAQPVGENNEGPVALELPTRPATGAAVIRMDLPCIPCGYNLRGLTAERNCPECGAPLADSISERRLLFADRRWLGRTVAGLRTLNAALLGLVVTGLGLPLLVSMLLPFLMDRPAARASDPPSAAAPAATQPGPNSRLSPAGASITQIFAWVLPVAWLGLLITFVIRIFLSTQSEPRAVLPRGLPVLTTLARIGLVLGLVLWFVGGRAPLRFRTAADVVETLTLSLGAAAALWHWSTLVARIPDARLGRSARQTAGGILLIGFLVLVLPLVPRDAVPPSARLLLDIVPLAGLLAFLVFVSLIARLRTKLRAVLATTVSRDALLK